jgi:antibiotic biosynthesis monooxygenase (ABM) superfamily enzyme
MTPPRYKLAVLAWVGIYPLITLVLWAISPLTSGVPLPVVTLVVSVVLVAVQTFLVMPLMTRLFRRWLRVDNRRTAPTHPDGRRAATKERS